MAKKDDEIAKRIREAAAAGNITFAPTDKIDDYDEIAAEFLLKIFNLKLSECMISDESSLSDFATCAIPDELELDDKSYQELQQIGKTFMLEKIHDCYGFDPASSSYLIDVFDLIRRDRLQFKH